MELNFFETNLYIERNPYESKKYLTIELGL